MIYLNVSSPSFVGETTTPQQWSSVSVSYIPLRLSSAQQVPQLPTAFHQGLLGPEPERLAGDLRTSQNNVVTETNT